MKYLERFFEEYIMIIIGVIVMAASMDMFLIPNKIAPGGVSGLATILYYLFSLNVGLVIAILNVPLFILAFRKLGFLFCIKSLFATALFSLAVDILPIPCITHDLLLASIFGGVLMGAGLGLVIKAGATTGGSDTAAVLAARVFKHIKINWLIFIIDFVVILIAAFVFSPELSLYGLAAIFISSKAAELVLEGPSTSRMIIIISKNSEAISSKILVELNRGVTSFSGTGMYSKQGVNVLLCVVHRDAEVQFVKDIVMNEDNSAFLIVGNVKEVLGEGF